MRVRAKVRGRARATGSLAAAHGGVDHDVVLLP